MRAAKSKLKKIIKEEAQKLLREQQRREKEIKQNIAYAQLAAEELRNQIKAAAPESDRSRAFVQRLQNVEGHIAKFQNELKPYHPTAQETYADVGMQSVMSPEQEREVLSGMEPNVSLEDWPPHRTVDWYATQATGKDWENFSSPEISAPFGQYMTTSGHPGIREAQAHQIIKEEFNHMLAEQYTAAAEYDPLLDPHGVDLGIEQSMFGAEGPGVIDYNQPPDLRQVHNVVPADRGQPHSEWMDEWAFNKERKKAVLDDIFFQVLDTIRKENPNLFDSPKQKKLPYVHYLNEEALKTE